MQKPQKLAPIPSPPTTLWKEFREVWMTKTAFVVALFFVIMIWRKHIYVPIENIPAAPKSVPTGN